MNLHQLTLNRGIEPALHARTEQPLDFYGEQIRQLQDRGRDLQERFTGGALDVHCWCQDAHDLLGELARFEPQAIQDWCEAILPLLVTSDFLRRCREQPRGY